MSKTLDQIEEQHKPSFSSSFCCCCCCCCSCSCSSPFSFYLKLFAEPFTIFFRNKHIFIPVLLFLTIPLSFLLFALSLSSRPLKRRILHLESLALRSPTRFEARNVLKESREESLSLLRLKLLFSLPSSILSLLSLVATVHATSLSLSPSHRPSLHSAAVALKLDWKRVLVASLCTYALFLFYVQLLQLFSAAFGNHPLLSLAIMVSGWGLEVYLMGVLGVGLVVSALEERYGWEAVRIASDSMAGRRLCWWLVNCMLVVVSGWIGNQFEKLTDGEDSLKSTAVMRWEMVVILCFYGVLIIWSFIVATIFYCGCKNQLHDRGANATANESPTGAAAELNDFTV